MDEIQYLEEYMSIESDILDINELREVAQYSYGYNLAIRQNFIYENMVATENVVFEKMKFTMYNAITLIKKLISEIIKLVLEFFSILTNQRKVLLVVHKKLTEAQASIRKTYNEKSTRMVREIDFEKRPIEIRSTYDTILKPVLRMYLIAIVLKVKLSDAKGGSNLPGLTDYNAMLRAGDKAISHEQSISTAGKLLNDTTLLITKIQAVKGILSNTELMDIIDGDITSGNDVIGTVASSYTVSGVASLISTLYGVTYNNSMVEGRNTNIFDQKRTTNIIADNIFSDATVSNIKDAVEDLKDSSSDIMEHITESDMVDIDSYTEYNKYIESVVTSAINICNAAKNVDFRKELKDMHSSLEKIKTDFSRLPDQVVGEMSENLRLGEILSAMSHLYSVCNSTVSSYVRKNTNMVNCGITDIKKVESKL